MVWKVDFWQFNSLLVQWGAWYDWSDQAQAFFCFFAPVSHSLCFLVDYYNSTISCALLEAELSAIHLGSFIGITVVDNSWLSDSNRKVFQGHHLLLKLIWTFKIIRWMDRAWLVQTRLVNHVKVMSAVWRLVCEPPRLKNSTVFNRRQQKFAVLVVCVALDLHTFNVDGFQVRIHDIVSFKPRTGMCFKFCA